ncbi:ArsR/SmtB family transcription factor [Agrococcus carbonis]|uniref:Helix-turn-helix domain-containing protein n=1 Tax=Agrococcus carbonis TaxID=684552 RepID=A0A1H1Q3S8_9MICO|nr:winged helix-turn-helix domain-containing protein [Agrococcus carbonis]SDS18060.1 Helix-turn-helix domain-containing protein [Agrococcus carbonis]
MAEQRDAQPSGGGADSHGVGTEEFEVDGGRGLRTGDPALLRALAHPLRVEILSVIDELGEATATQIAEKVGESPSNCSFHLRTLAKAGFIERAEAQGTSKPWKPVHQSRDLRPDPSNPESMRTSASVAAMYVQHEANRMVDFLTRHGLGDERWLPGTTVNSAAIWATPDELAQLAEDIHHLVDRFQGRSKDPSKRPAGSRKAHLFATLNPDFDLPATGEEPAGA